MSIDHSEHAAVFNSLIARMFVRLRSGHVRSLARAVSLVEDGMPDAAALLSLCRDALRGRVPALRIGITGPAGAGKSTVVDALTRLLRAQGRRVGIVAVDPSSAFSGGAILGDRIRLADFAGDSGVFMRSMAARGHLGGLARTTDDVLTVIEAAGFDLLLIETTGVGQAEIEVASLADAVAVVLVPGMGDSVQSLKAGVLEIASVFVLNKADSPGIDRLEAEIAEMQALSALLSGSTQSPAVLRTVATTGEGVNALLETLNSLAARGEDSRTRPRSVPRSLPRSTPVLDHLGIAVQSIEKAFGFYRALGMVPSRIEEVAHERVRVAMLATGDSRIELLEATEPDSAVGRFLAKRGEGLHHIALRVADLAATVERLKAQGIRLVSESIEAGAGGHRYVFVHPSSANGVLVELVEASEGDSH